MKETATAVAKYPSRRATHPVLAPFYALKFYGNAENRSTVPHISLSPRFISWDTIKSGRAGPPTNITGGNTPTGKVI